jgi:hypothetical protein
MLLAEAALDATSLMTTSFPPDHHFRMLYVLNTDGEAHDGQAAAERFLAGYNELKGKFPNMIEARTFVLGIGANHDQKVELSPSSLFLIISNRSLVRCQLVKLHTLIMLITTWPQWSLTLSHEFIQSLLVHVNL